MKKLFLTGFLFLFSVFFSVSFIGVAAKVSVDMAPVQKSTLLKSASSNEVYQKQFYSSYYFSHLNDNIGINVKGSCTYIALGMLLQYYDTYYDDSIIP